MNKTISIPIVEGIYGSSNDYRSMYPQNMRVVPQDTGASTFYLKTCEGIETLGSTPGICSGGINWNGTPHALLGDSLCTISENGECRTLVSGITPDLHSRFDYSFDRLAFCSGGTLWYWDGKSLSYLGQGASRPSTHTLSLTTDSSGFSSGFYVAPFDYGETVITAISTISESLSILSGGGTVAQEKLSLSVSSSTVVANGSHYVTVASDVGVAKKKVVFTTNKGSLTSNTAMSGDSGIAIVSLVTDLTQGTATVTAYSGLLSDSISVSFVSIAPTTLSLTANRVSYPNGDHTFRYTEPQHITAHVTGADSQILVDCKVTFKITTAETGGGSLSSSTAFTDSAGNASVLYTPGTTAVTEVISVWEDVLESPETITVNVNNSTGVFPYTLSLVSEHSSIVANGSSTTILTATLLDHVGSPVQSVDIDFVATKGELTVSSATTNASGVATTTLFSTHQTGISTITASYRGTFALKSVIFENGPVSTITLHMLPQMSIAGKSVRIASLLKDINGNACNGSIVSLSIPESLVGGYLSNAPEANDILSSKDSGLYKVIDFVWMDGYFVFTDGVNISITSLNNPRTSSVLDYGSSEADPDNIQCLLKLRGELWAINRHTIEAFQNVGGTTFPFARVQGTRISRGAVGTRMAAILKEQIVFVGGGRNEAVSVWACGNSSTLSISTREIDRILSTIPEETLSTCYSEVRIFEQHEYLYIHLPLFSLVYDATASTTLSKHIWHIEHSGVRDPEMYRANKFIYAYNKWICFDKKSPLVGVLSTDTHTHFGVQVGWMLHTPIFFNSGQGFIVRTIELSAVSGDSQSKSTSYITSSYSENGAIWSQEIPILAHAMGYGQKRLVWFLQGVCRNRRIYRFWGSTETPLSVLSLQVDLEPLSV